MTKIVTTFSGTDGALSSAPFSWPVQTGRTTHQVVSNQVVPTNVNAGSNCDVNLNPTPVVGRTQRVSFVLEVRPTAVETFGVVARASTGDNKAYFLDVANFGTGYYLRLGRTHDDQSYWQELIPFSDGDVCDLVVTEIDSTHTELEAYWNGYLVSFGSGNFAGTWTGGDNTAGLIIDDEADIPLGLHGGIWSYTGNNPAPTGRISWWQFEDFEGTNDMPSFSLKMVYDEDFERDDELPIRGIWGRPYGHAVAYNKLVSGHASTGSGGPAFSIHRGSFSNYAACDIRSEGEDWDAGLLIQTSEHDFSQIGYYWKGWNGKLYKHYEVEIGEITGYVPEDAFIELFRADTIALGGQYNPIGDDVVVRKNGVEVIRVTDTYYDPVGTHNHDGFYVWGGGNIVDNWTNRPSTAPLTPTATQRAYRWMNDDGSESASTAYDAESTDVLVPANVVKRLRIQVDFTGTPEARGFKLQHRKVGDTTWKDTKP